LDVLKFGGEVALEIMLDDEDAEEIGIAPGTDDVPGKRGETEAGDGDRMEAAEGVTPTPGEYRPQQYTAAGENDGGRALRERGETEEKAEEEQTHQTPGGRVCVQTENRCVKLETDGWNEPKDADG